MYVSISDTKLYFIFTMSDKVIDGTEAFQYLDLLFCSTKHTI